MALENKLDTYSCNSKVTVSMIVNVWYEYSMQSVIEKQYFYKNI